MIDTKRLRELIAKGASDNAPYYFADMNDFSAFIREAYTTLPALLDSHDRVTEFAQRVIDKNTENSDLIVQLAAANARVAELEALIAHERHQLAVTQENHAAEYYRIATAIGCHVHDDFPQKIAALTVEVESLRHKLFMDAESSTIAELTAAEAQRDAENARAEKWCSVAIKLYCALPEPHHFPDDIDNEYNALLLAESAKEPS